MEYVAISSLVPDDHLLRKIDQAADFRFIRERVKHLYCENNGRPALDPVVLFKLLLLGYLFGVRSERQLMREVEVNVAYRWFLGLRLRDKVPDASTLSQNRRRQAVAWPPLRAPAGTAQDATAVSAGSHRTKYQEDRPVVGNDGRKSVPNIRLRAVKRLSKPSAPILPIPAKRWTPPMKTNQIERTRQNDGVRQQSEARDKRLPFFQMEKSYALAFSRAALAASRAVRAVPTRLVNPAASLAAMSARILRSSVLPASFRPLMNVE